MNYKKQTSKALKEKLNDATLSAEEREEITAILTARGVSIENEAANEKPTIESKLKAAKEAVAETEEATEQKPSETKKKKLTEEELNALVDQCKVNINHKCSVVPFNTAEWKDGVISGIMIDSRNNKVIYTIRLIENNKRIAKSSDSPLLKISDEVVESAIKTRTRNAKKKTDEAFAEETEIALSHIYDTLIIGDETIGTIEAIILNTKTKSVIYKVKDADGKFQFKTYNADYTYVAIEEDDTETLEKAAKYIERFKLKLNLTPEQQLIALQGKRKKLEEAIAEIDNKIRKLVDAQSAENTETEAEAEDSENAEDDGDNE
jgi:hypothetical protein